jgi:MFS family permease
MSDTAEDGLPLPQRYWAILTLIIGLVASVLDTAIVNIALPAIVRDLHSSAAESIWVINAYQLTVVISLLPLASLGDIFGFAASTQLVSRCSRARRSLAPCRTLWRCWRWAELCRAWVPPA